MVINKYLLYFIFIILLAGFTFNKQIQLIFNGELVDATYVGKTWIKGYKNSRLSLTYTYNYGKYKYTYVVPSYINDKLLQQWDNKIILNKNNPEYAKLNTLLCILTPNLILFIPLLLLLSSIFLSVDLLPKHIRIKKITV